MRLPGAEALLGDKDDSALYRGVLESFPVQDAVAKATNQDFEDIRKYLHIEPKLPVKQLAVYTIDSDKDRGEKAVKTALGKLTEITRSFGFNKAERTAELLKQVIEENQAKLGQAEAKVLAYTKQMKAPTNPQNPAEVTNMMRKYYDLQAEYEILNKQVQLAKSGVSASVRSALDTPTSIPGLEKWRNQLVQANVELRQAESLYGPDAPEIRALKAKVETLEQAASEEVNRYLKGVGNGVNNSIFELVLNRQLVKWKIDSLKPVVENAPTEAVTLKRLMIEQTLRENILSNLRKQYEEARITQQVDRAKWAVLEPVHTLEKPTNKSFGKHLLIATPVALLLYGLLALGGAARQPAKSANTKLGF